MKEYSPQLRDSEMKPHHKTVLCHTQDAILFVGNEHVYSCPRTNISISIPTKTRTKTKHNKRKDKIISFTHTEILNEYIITNKKY